jgi:hypothetical protein
VRIKTQLLIAGISDNDWRLIKEVTRVDERDEK